MFSKKQVRRKFILLRKNEHFPSNSIFFKPLINLIQKRRKKKISLYYPSNYEFDTIKLFEILKKKGDLSTSLPVILSKNSMKFVKWKLSDPLRVNRYGFLEPILTKKKFIPDLILVPIVAFDKFHNRLGYGRGYYDRFLGKYLKKNRNTLTIGLAFSFQKYKKIPTSKFDIKLDYILTEKGIF